MCRREELHKGAIMRWHAMQRPEASAQGDEYSQSERLSADSKHDSTHKRVSISVDGTQYATSPKKTPYITYKEEPNLYNMSFTGDTASSSNDEEQHDTSKTPTALDIDMPRVAPSITTEAYQRAMRHRHIEQLLWNGEKFNPNRYTPTFVHDILMLPGSLANLLDKPTRDIEEKMTPAFLPGYKSSVQNKTLQPAIIHSEDPSSHIQGMLVFGLGKAARHLIHKKYHTTAKRRKVQIEVELLALVDDPSPTHHFFQQKVYRPQRRVVQAHAWLWSKKRGGDDFLDGSRWSLEDYLLGNLGPKQTALRIETSGKGDEDEDGWIGRYVEEVEIDPEREEKREVVYGGSGSLDYERVEGVEFTGW